MSSSLHDGPPAHDPFRVFEELFERLIVSQWAPDSPAGDVSDSEQATLYGTALQELRNAARPGTPLGTALEELRALRHQTRPETPLNEISGYSALLGSTLCEYTSNGVLGRLRSEADEGDDGSTWSSPAVSLQAPLWHSSSRPEVSPPLSTRHPTARSFTPLSGPSLQSTAETDLAVDLRSATGGSSVRELAQEAMELAHHAGAAFDDDMVGDLRNDPTSARSSQQRSVYATPRSAVSTQSVPGGNTMPLEDGGLVSVLRALAELDLDDSQSLVNLRQLGAVLAGERLSDEDIQLLPKVRFEEQERQCCSICLESYVTGELLTRLPCDHYFHVDCIAGWMQRANRCPLCRGRCGE